ncbi:MAG: DNA replication/repair protein RecF [Chloroflexi bacterium]|nr:DNA replication/repair protein RecF [Chloroflexota bacterium]
MHVVTLNLLNFRNYARLDLELPVGPLVVQGGNAQGKSNLLDAVHILATGRSMRGGPEAAWINVDAPDEAHFARIRAQVQGASGEERLELVVARTSAGGGVRRRVRIGGAARRLADLPGRLQAVSFAPADLTLLTGPPRERRRWLDMALAQLDRDYVSTLADYEVVLTRRNALLRRIRAGHGRPPELDFWDARLAPLAVQVVRRREDFVKAMQPLLAAEYAQITDDPSLAVSYAATATAADPSEHVEALRQARTGDVERGVTSLGPHRDDLALHLGTHLLASFGSRGQLRLAGVALKLAQFELAQRRTGERPVLLLDDVAAELDPHHRRLLLERLTPSAQTIVTTADPAGLDAALLDRAAHLVVERGCIRATHGPA